MRPVTGIGLPILFALGGLALVAVLLSWAAERSLDRAADEWSFADVARLPEVEAAVVLGTAPIGPEGGPNVYFVRRLDAAAALWRAGKARILVVSGSGDEPEAMKAGLVARGVPAEAIRLDPEGPRTWDSVRRARDGFGLRRAIFVSQRFHLSRALFLARHAGIEAWGYEARDVERPYSFVTTLRRYPSALRAWVDAWLQPGASR